MIRTAVKMLQGLLLIAAFMLIVWLVLEGADRVGLNAVGYCEQEYWGNPERIKACEAQQIEDAKNMSPEERARHQRVLDLFK